MTAPEPRLACRACGHDTAPLGVQYCDRCFGALDLLAAPPAADRPWTPLVPAPALGSTLGLGDLWLKDETANPTASFKDRVVAATSRRAAEVGSGVLACSSTGNLARAVAVGAAAAGQRAVVVVPESLSAPERESLVAHGAMVVAVRGDYDAANRLAAEASDELGHWGWVNGNLRPWYGAGAATLAIEVLGQGPPPAQLVLPMASGALAYQSVRACSAAGVRPRLLVGQPAGCAPVAAAFAAGDAEVGPVRPATRVEVLAMGDPPEGHDVLQAARRSGGAVLAVAEDRLEDVVTGVRDDTGILIDLASAVAVAAARDAVRAGVADPDARTVVVLTGGPPRWPAAPVVGAGVAVTIEPSLAALRDAVAEEIP